MDIPANFSLIINQFKSMFYFSFLNRLLILSCSAQVASMFVKAIINSFRVKKLDFNNMANYGGMPSSHTVFVTSFVFGIAFDPNYGFGSPLFVISVIIASIIMMDTVRLRGTVDKLNDILREVVIKDAELEKKVKLPKHIRHTASEVIGGLIFSFIYTLIFYTLFYGIFK